MTPVFRAATRADLPSVVAMLSDDRLGAIREGTDMAPYLAAFDGMLAEGANQLIVAEADGRLVASYQLVFISCLSMQGTRRAMLESVRVVTDLRGRGIGHLLVADAEARARAAGCRLMQLTTHASRADAHRFYAAQGYEQSHLGFKRDL